MNLYFINLLKSELQNFNHKSIFKKILKIHILYSYKKKIKIHKKISKYSYKIIIQYTILSFFFH